MWASARAAVSGHATASGRCPGRPPASGLGHHRQFWASWAVLIDDCREAFRHPFQHPITGEVGHICSFVIANAGSFGDNTPENFHEDARNREHRGHVRLLDGKALLHLDRHATAARVEQVGEILNGLLLEIRFNSSLLPTIKNAMQATLQEQKRRPILERVRTNAASHYLQKPFLPALIPTDHISRYLFTAERAVNSPLDDVTGEIVTVKTLADRAKVVLIGITAMEALGAGIAVAIQSVLNTLAPLAAV